MTKTKAALLCAVSMLFASSAQAQPLPVLPPSINVQSNQIVGPGTITNNSGLATILKVYGIRENVTVRGLQTNGGYRVLATAASGTIKPVLNGLTVDGLLARNVNRDCITLRGSGKNIVLRNVDCQGDSTPQTSISHLQEGVAINGRFDNILIENSRFSTFRMVMAGYINGDGVAAERESSNLTIRRTVSIDNTDGGYDLKTAKVRLEDVYAARNKRDFRFWGADVQATTLYCGDFTNACIWGAGSNTGQVPQIVRIGKLVVRKGGPASGYILLAESKDQRTTFIIGECDFEGPAGQVIKSMINRASVLGPGCNVVKPLTHPLVIPNFVGQKPVPAPTPAPAPAPAPTPAPAPVCLPAAGERG